MGGLGRDTRPTSRRFADQARSLDVQTWRLSLGGAVAMPRDFSYDELVAAGDELEATLDCTGGFYSTQRWRGIHIGRLLDQASLHPGARYLRFLSGTRYPRCLPAQQPRAGLLATPTL